MSHARARFGAMGLLAACAAFDGSMANEDGGLTAAELEALPTCSLAAPGDRLDLENACADGLCYGIRFGDAVALLGEPADCPAFDGSPGSPGQSVGCQWLLAQLVAYFRDGDDDGRPEDDVEADEIDIRAEWDGSDPSGLALGISLRCFYDVLGEPTNVNHQLVGGLPTDVITGFLFGAPGSLRVTIRDDEGGGVDHDQPDGVVDGIGFTMWPQEGS